MRALAARLTPEEEFRALMRRYRNKPVEWIEDFTEYQLMDWQKDALRGFVRTGKLVVRSGRGAGKTVLMCLLLLWLLFTHWPIRALVTAPTFPQLRQIVFAELRNAVQKCRFASMVRWTPTEIHVAIPGPPGRIVSSAYARTSRRKEGVAGFHAPPAWRGDTGVVDPGGMAVFADEASGVEDIFIESAIGSNTDDPTRRPGEPKGGRFFCYTSNPTRLKGFFYDSFNKKALAQEWHRVAVSCLNVPNPPIDFITEMKTRYGEDSDQFRVHVLGEFPEGEMLGLVPSIWLNEVRLESVTNFSRLAARNDGFVIGVDVARGGDDSTAICVRQGRLILADYLEEIHGMSVDAVASRVRELYNELLSISPVQTDSHVKLRPLVCVDTVGIGAGVYDMLKAWQVNAKEVVASERAPNTTPRCHRLRDWLYWQIREFFNPENDSGALIVYRSPRKRAVVDQLILEIGQLRYSTDNPLEAIQIESKYNYRKRNQGESSNCADALMLTMARSGALRKAAPKPLTRVRRPAAAAVGWVV